MHHADKKVRTVKGKLLLVVGGQSRRRRQNRISYLNYLPREYEHVSVPIPVAISGPGVVPELASVPTSYCIHDMDGRDEPEQKVPE
ncbi:hypothetical protein E4U09_006440 [Claviceps aff. purpurea]|uniref:Uncharacterized protein n=1 Tax=Claviceps aff. purpurea TaxID=1967640 RepID=A0A9P7U3F8_9HYPO|nr:hypothetical protein E4U09_006440 [Claviceps aff. purpurea]